jgi:hypothetical protein
LPGFELYATAAAVVVVMTLLLLGHLTFYLSTIADPRQDSCRVLPLLRLVGDRSWLPIGVLPAVVEASSSHLLVLVQFRWAVVLAMASMVRYHWAVVVQVQMEI